MELPQSQFLSLALVAIFCLPFPSVCRVEGDEHASCVEARCRKRRKGSCGCEDSDGDGDAAGAARRREGTFGLVPVHARVNVRCCALCMQLQLVPEKHHVHLTRKTNTQARRNSTIITTLGSNQGGVTCAPSSPEEARTRPSSPTALMTMTTTPGYVRLKRKKTLMTTTTTTTRRLHPARTSVNSPSSP